MGYIRHNAIIVTSFDEDAIRKALKKACEIFDRPISSLIGGEKNSYRSFLIPPDGSKEGWDCSDRNDGQRREYLNWLSQQGFDDGSTILDWVEVKYGDERGTAEIVAGSEEHLWDND